MVQWHNRSSQGTSRVFALLRSVPFFVIVWLLGFVVRRLMGSSSRSRTRYGVGSSGPWGQTYRGPQGDASVHSTAQSPYEVLGVRPGASQEEIQAAYRRLVQEYHPDKVADLGQELRDVAERRMKEINAAYEHFKRRATG